MSDDRASDVRGLGCNQRSALYALHTHKVWYRSGMRVCGWIIDNDSGTRRIFDGLIKRGLVKERSGVYKLSREGQRVVHELKRSGKLFA